MHKLRVGGLDHRRFLICRMPAVLAKHLPRDIVAEQPPIDEQRVDLILQRNLVRQLLKNEDLRTMPVEDYDVPETVVHQTHQHRADINSKCILWNMQAAGIRREDVRDAIRNMRSNQRVDVASNGIGHRYGIVRTVVDEPVRFERTNGQDYSFDFCRDKLLRSEERRVGKECRSRWWESNIRER